VVEHEETVTLKVPLSLNCDLTISMTRKPTAEITKFKALRYIGATQQKYKKYMGGFNCKKFVCVLLKHVEVECRITK